MADEQDKPKVIDNFLDWIQEVGKPQLIAGWDSAHSVNENALRITEAAWEAAWHAALASRPPGVAVDPADVDEALDRWWTEQLALDGSAVHCWSSTETSRVKAALKQALLAICVKHPEAAVPQKTCGTCEHWEKPRGLCDDGYCRTLRRTRWRGDIPVARVAVCDYAKFSMPDSPEKPLKYPDAEKALPIKVEVTMTGEEQMQQFAQGVKDHVMGVLSRTYVRGARDAYAQACEKAPKQETPDDG